MPGRKQNRDTHLRDHFSGRSYRPESISRVPLSTSHDYFDILLNRKLDLVRKYLMPGDAVLDLCCATGKHLQALSPHFRNGVGLDFGHHFLKAANVGCEGSNDRLSYVEADACCVPLRSESFDLVYSLSSLYVIPNLQAVVAEISRVLKPGGVCILDLGNLYSLNTLVARAHPELARDSHLPVSVMLDIFDAEHLQVVDHRAFQILPLWGNRPWWLKPVLMPVWKRIMQKRIRGKMLDELISNLPLVKLLAFRHLFVCRKNDVSG